MVDNISFSEEAELIFGIKFNQPYAQGNKLANYLKQIFSLMTLKTPQHMSTGIVSLQPDSFFPEAGVYFRTYESFVQNDIIFRSSRRDKVGTIEHQIASKNLRISNYRPFYMVINRLTEKAFKTPAI